MVVVLLEVAVIMTAMTPFQWSMKEVWAQLQSWEGMDRQWAEEVREVLGPLRENLRLVEKRDPFGSSFSTLKT